VELDDFLGDLPVQFREVQGYEAPEFLKLFAGTVRYMDGGIESGFNHVTPKQYKPRLFWIKGTSPTDTRVTQVPLERKALNDGDVFVLDNGLSLFQWNGKSSGVWEKRKGGEVVAGIKSERSGKPKASFLNSGEDDVGFWGLLAGGKGPIPAAIPDEQKTVKKPTISPSMARVKPGESKPEFQSIQLKKTVPIAKPKVEPPKKTAGAGGGFEEAAPVMLKRGQEAVYMPGEAPPGHGAGGKMKRSDLSTNDVFIFDAVEALYTWVGKAASIEDRREAILKGVEYLKQHNRPLHTPVIRVIEANETEAFWTAFDAANA